MRSRSSSTSTSARRREGLRGTPWRVAGLALALAGCKPEAAPAAPPARTAHERAAPDAVLRVGAVDVRRAELEPLAQAIGLLHPEYVERQRLRLALTSVALPRAAAAARWPAERAAARAACEASAALLAAGAPPAAQPVPVEGAWKALGLETWRRVRAAPSGAWSEPFEEVGAFRLARRLDGAPDAPARAPLRAEILSFPYLPPEGATSALEDALDRAELEIVDPAFGELVPESWKHRMRGATR